MRCVALLPIYPNADNENPITLGDIVMDFGIQLATSVHHWKIVKKAEERGFTHAWFYDTQMQNSDLFVSMALAAANTTKINLCTGVLIPSNRIAPVTANALATLNVVAPGRIQLGLGTGFTGRRTMGLPAITLARLEKYIRVVDALLKGETVEWDEEGKSRKVRFMVPELELINLKDPIPIHLSAFGPKARAMVAKLGTGWIGGSSRADRASASVSQMRDEWRKAGRNVSELYMTSLGSGCVLAEGEAADSPRARAQAGPSATMAFHDYAERSELGSLGFDPPPPFKAQFDAYREIYQSYQPADARYLENHRGHLMFLRPEEEKLVTPELIKAMTMTGTQAELVENVQALREAGYNQLSIHLRLGHEDEMLDDWTAVIEKAA